MNRDMTLNQQIDNYAITQDVAAMAREANDEIKRLEARNAELEKLLGTAFHSEHDYEVTRVAARRLLEAFDAIIVQCGDGTMPKGWLAAANQMRQALGRE